MRFLKEETGLDLVAPTPPGSGTLPTTEGTHKDLEHQRQSHKQRINTTDYYNCNCVYYVFKLNGNYTSSLLAQNLAKEQSEGTNLKYRNLMKSFSEQFACFLIWFLSGSESHTLIWPFKPKFNYSMEKTGHALQGITVLAQHLKGTNNVKVSCYSLQNNNISSTNLARLTHDESI